MASSRTRNLAYLFMHAQMLSHVRLFETLQTVACQAPLSVGLFRPEYQSGLPFPPRGDLLGPGIKPVSPVSPALQAASLPTELLGKPWSLGQEDAMLLCNFCTIEPFECILKCVTLDSPTLQCFYITDTVNKWKSVNLGHRVGCVWLILWAGGGVPHRPSGLPVVMYVQFSSGHIWM